MKTFIFILRIITFHSPLFNRTRITLLFLKLSNNYCQILWSDPHREMMMIIELMIELTGGTVDS